MDELALQRATERIAQAREGRDLVRFEAVLERSRTQIEALATTASELEIGLPERIQEAVGEGFRREVLPVGRQLAERHARIDDLSLLVDLVSSGWRAVEARLAGLEEHDMPQDAEQRMGAEQRSDAQPAEHRVVPLAASTAA